MVNPLVGCIFLGFWQVYSLYLLLPSINKIEKCVVKSKINEHSYVVNQSRTDAVLF